MMDYFRDKGYFDKYSKEMMDYLRDKGYFDKTDEEINNFLIENRDKIKEIDMNVISYRLLLGEDFQILFYEQLKYIRYLENFILFLKKKKLRKGYKKLPKHFYNSYDWADIRIIILNRDNFKCRHCGALANHIDHINSAKYFPEMALDPTNLLSSCEDCHKNRQKRSFENKL